MLRSPKFPGVFSYLFTWYGEFLLWQPSDREPEWSDWQAWATMMRRDVTPYDLRMLARIHRAFHAVQREAQTNNG